MQAFTSGVYMIPPTIDSSMVMQRADEVSAIQRMLTDGQTHVIMLTGSSGTGKSTLAALVYHRLLLTKQVGMTAPRYLVWLNLNSYTTLPSLLSAILSGVEVQMPNLFLLKPEQQIAAVLRALKRQSESAFIVLDQFELLLHPEVEKDTGRRGRLSFFLELLHANLGASRLLLTCCDDSFKQLSMTSTHILSYRVSHISMPEGIALLQQRGIQGTHEELSLIYQRCRGHVFALLLFYVLAGVSGIAPGHLVLAPEYQILWSGEVTLNVLAMLYQYLNPLQRQWLRALSLFSEPVPLQAVSMTIAGGSSLVFPDAQQFYQSVECELQILTSLALVQSVRDIKQEEYFSLHPLLHKFVQEHYLENAEHSPKNGSTMIVLGVNRLPGPLPDNTQARQIALAAGHMHVASYYCSLAQQCPPHEQRKHVQDVEPFIATIRHLCLGWHWQQACDLLFKEGLHETLVRLGAWNVLIELYTSLLPPLGILTRCDEGLVVSQLAMLYGRIGEVQQSQVYFEQALALQHETEDTYGEAVTLANQGELCRMRGEREQAHINFEKAMMLSRQRGDQQSQQNIHLQCIVLHNMGLLYHDAKDYAPALSCYIRALHLTYKLQELYDKGIILTNLGMLLYEQGQQRDGMAMLLASLQLRQVLQDPSVVLLEHFLAALEHLMGANAYANLYQSALDTQQHVFTHLMQTNV